MEQTATSTNRDPRPAPQPPVRRLVRTDGPISGVAGGLADYFNADPALIRLAIVAATLLAGPVVPIAYVAAWAIIPRSETPTTQPVAPGPPAPSEAPTPPAPSAGPVPPAPSAAPTTGEALQDTVEDTTPQPAEPPDEP